MRIRRQFVLPLLAVLVAAGIVATDCLHRVLSLVERRNAHSIVESRTSALRSTRSVSDAQSEASTEKVENSSVASVSCPELSDDVVVQIRELAEVDPAAVTEAALREPVSAPRDRMLLEALPLWADREPAAAAEWLAARAPARELDLGLLALVRHPALATKTPDTALGLACEIADPALRHGALRNVVQDWLQRDPARLRTVLEQSRDITAADRAMLLSELDGLLVLR